MCLCSKKDKKWASLVPIFAIGFTEVKGIKLLLPERRFQGFSKVIIIV